MNDSDKITMTLTRREWRIIAASCSKVKRSAFINGSDHMEASRIALVVASVTGRED